MATGVPSAAAAFRYTFLFVRTMGTLAILGLLVGGAKVARLKETTWASDRMLEMAFFVIFLVYPSTSAPDTEKI